MAQTTVQVANAIRFGSAKFELGATVGALVDVGAIRSGVFEYAFDKVTVESDNAGIISQGIRNETAALAGDMMEINTARLGEFYDGVLTYAVVAGVPTAVTDEAQTLAGTTGNALTNANGDGTEVTAIVVQDSAGTNTLVRDSDYLISLLANGKTSIARAYPAVIEAAAGDVTPNNAGTYTSGSSGFALNLVPGDHVIIAGCTTAANDGVKTIVTATADVLTVSEAVTTEAPAASVTVTKGAIADGDVVDVDYSYTPNASKTLKGGGLTTFDAKVARFTNTDEDGKIFRITIFESSPEAGITIAFQSDDADDPAVNPIRMTGVPDTDLTAGEQLFEIYDEQTG